jgi:hypothetical protein
LPVILGQRSAIRTVPWLGAFLEEILAFPNSKHDDRADSLGLIGQLLDKMMVGKRPINRARKFDPDKDAYRPFRTIGSYKISSRTPTTSRAAKSYRGRRYRAIESHGRVSLKESVVDSSNGSQSRLCESESCMR